VDSSRASCIAQNGSLSVWLASERRSSPARELHFDPLNRDRDGLLVEVRDAGRLAWYGVFAFGEGGCTSAAFLNSTTQLAVVALGQLYLLNATAPTDWAAPDLLFVEQLVSGPSFEGLVGCTHWDVFVVWSVHEVSKRRLDADGIYNLQVIDKCVSGEYERVGGSAEQFSFRLDRDEFPDRLKIEAV
jgi:hypothetical protein